MYSYSISGTLAVHSRLGVVYSMFGSSHMGHLYRSFFLGNFLPIDSVRERKAHRMASKQVSIRNNASPEALGNSYVFTVLHIPYRRLLSRENQQTRVCETRSTACANSPRSLGKRAFVVRGFVGLTVSHTAFQIM